MMTVLFPNVFTHHKPEKTKDAWAEEVNKRVVVSDKEHNFARKVDDALASQGYESKKMWPQCTIALSIVMLILTCLVCFYKPDFLNMTVCVVAIYILDRETSDSAPCK